MEHCSLAVEPMGYLDFVGKVSEVAGRGVEHMEVGAVAWGRTDFDIDIDEGKIALMVLVEALGVAVDEYCSLHGRLEQLRTPLHQDRQDYLIHFQEQGTVFVQFWME